MRPGWLRNSAASGVRLATAQRLCPTFTRRLRVDTFLVSALPLRKTTICRTLASAGAAATARAVAASAALRNRSDRIDLHLSAAERLQSHRVRSRLPPPRGEEDAPEPGRSAQAQDPAVTVDRHPQAAAPGQLAADQGNRAAVKAQPRPRTRRARAQALPAPGAPALQALPAAGDPDEARVTVVDRHDHAAVAEGAAVPRAVDGAHAELVAEPRLAAEVRPGEDGVVLEPRPRAGLIGVVQLAVLDVVARHAAST